jgi:hypothetical protein
MGHVWGFSNEKIHLLRNVMAFCTKEDFYPRNGIPYWHPFVARLTG